MKSAGHIRLLILLCLFTGAEGAKCAELFKASHPNAEAALVCQDFAGDSKLHAIIYGCGAVNQESELPTGYTAQSFTEKCEAHLSGTTTYTCFQMAEGADYSAFKSSVDPNLACAKGDTFDSPKYMHLQTTAKYTQGWGWGSQSTSVPTGRSTFDDVLVTEAYYSVVVTGNEAVTQNAASPKPTKLVAPEVDTPAGNVGPKCAALYAAAHPSAEATLDCKTFVVGNPKLHAIVYGCGPVNQGFKVPAGYSSQSFTEKCEARLTHATTYTCFQMADGTDYTAFTSSVDPNLACSEGDPFDSPKYMYLQTMAESAPIGGLSQSTDVTNVRSAFDEALVTETYMVVVPKDEKTSASEARTNAVAPDNSASAGNEVDTDGCYRGADAEVTAACHDPANKRKGPCCVGDRACEWPNGITVTVCPYTCIGKEACMLTNNFLVIPQEITIGRQACRSTGACRDVGIYQNYQAPVTIGQGSCNGEDACHSMSGSVGQGSCNKDHACLAVVGNVGSLSCIDAPGCCLFATSVGDCVDHCQEGGSCASACPN